MIEIKLTGRPPSTIPGDVGIRLMGRDVESNRELAQRLNPYVHWGHGTMLGAVRGLLDVAGLAFWPATIVFYLVLEGGDMVLYRALGIQPWPWQWNRASLVRDLALKAVLAIAISAVYAASSWCCNARRLTRPRRTQPAVPRADGARRCTHQAT